MSKLSITSLLRRNVSAAQIAGYIAASLIGLSIMAIGLRFWSDTTTGNVQGSFLVIQKKPADILSSSGSDAGRFTAEEINLIDSQPWAARTGEFTTADFDVSASVRGAGRALSTALFLEAVPDSFMDIVPDGWSYTPESSDELPIVLPREYLSLYNYGFAPSRGLPQITEAMASLVPIELSVSGNGIQQTFRGHIAGFSSRINTIAVPAEFIRYANNKFGTSDNLNPSRLIVETVSPGDPTALQWINEHGYETITDSAVERLGSLASAGAAVTVIAGSLILILALFILTLSIHLLLFKNRRILFDLMQLGYTPAQTALPYMVAAATVNIIVAAAAIAIACLTRNIWIDALSTAGLPGGSPMLCIVITFAVALLLTLINSMTIRQMTRLAFRKQ